MMNLMSRNLWLAPAWGLAVVIGVSAACQAQTAPAPAPAPGTTPGTPGAPASPAATAPTSQPAAGGVDPAVVSLLERHEQKAATVKSLEGDIRYDRIQGLLGDKQRRIGKLVYLAGPPAQFSVHFDWLLIDTRRERQDRWYIFDGQWFVEKLEDQKPKQFFKREVAAPGQKIDPLALGSGPFVLPVTLKKDVVLQRFVTTLEAPAEKDPANTVHLKLVPRPGQRIDYSQIDLYLDKDTLFLKRARAYEEKSLSESIIDVVDQLKVNGQIDPKALDTSEPKEAGWEVHIQPWEKR